MRARPPRSRSPMRGSVARWPLPGRPKVRTPCGEPRYNVICPRDHRPGVAWGSYPGSAERKHGNRLPGWGPRTPTDCPQRLLLGADRPP